MKYFLDTNAVLDLGKSIFNYSPFMLSDVTLQELEAIKTNRNKIEDLRHKAKKVVKLLLNNLGKYEVIHFTSQVNSIMKGLGADDIPDNRICACVVRATQLTSEEIVFITSDLCCTVNAQDIFHLKTETPKISEKIYKGYQLLKGNTAEIIETMSDPSFMNKFARNEYLLTYNIDTDSEGEMRFDGEKFVNLKLPPSRYIKGKNALQRCALDILNNQDITVAAILGCYGSGKTFLALRMALYAVCEKGYQSRAVGIREPIGEGRESGYLPGSLDEKLENYFLPLVHNLDGGEFELESLKQRGILESISPHYLKGTTYSSSILLVDEAEDLTEKQIKLIGTRLGEESRVFFSGDYKQSIINATESNALVEMIESFKGNKNFGCIYLNSDVRSSTSQMFANLFE